MKLLILDDYAKISDFAAAYLCKRINEVKPTAERPFVLGLPTGNFFVVLECPTQYWRLN
jgi:glucosamine-6-phosphate deaminase